MNRWAYRRGLLITGLRQRWLDFVSIFRPATPDLVDPRLLEHLARRKHYLSQDPHNYSLVTTLHALHAISRTLLGRRGAKREEERAVTTEQVSRPKVAALLKLAGEVAQSHGTHDRYGLSLDDMEAIFHISLDILQRFKLELYPVLLKAIGSVYEFEDTSPEKHGSILGCLGLREEEILTARRFYEQEARQKEKQLVDQQLLPRATRLCSAVLR